MALRMRGLARLARTAGACRALCLPVASLTPPHDAAAAPSLAPSSRVFAAAASPPLLFPGGEPDAPRVVTPAIPGPRSKALQAEMAAMQDAGGVKFFGATRSACVARPEARTGPPADSVPLQRTLLRAGGTTWLTQTATRCWTCTATSHRCPSATITRTCWPSFRHDTRHTRPRGSTDPPFARRTRRTCRCWRTVRRWATCRPWGGRSAWVTRCCRLRRPAFATWRP